VRGILALLLVLGCKSNDNQPVAMTQYIADYHGLEDDASWTYRDDDISDASPDDARLLRARYLGKGVMDFRRGSRWADGRTQAMLVFELDAEFKIIEWKFAGEEGEGDLALGTDQPAQGQSVLGDDWFCSTGTEGIGVTYYGIFEDIVQYDCEGDAGPAGTFIFALEVGLVHFSGENYTLNLVAPW